MARERSLNGDASRFCVADFAHENNVRVLAYQRAQPGDEGNARFRVDITLNDARQLVFYRVFNRHNVPINGIQGVEAGVERGGLAASCWAAYRGTCPVDGP